MPIMNYTTKVDVFATLGEIQGQLVKHGAKKIMQDYDNDGHITALSFLIDTPNGPRGVKLPANVDAVWNVLTKQKVKCDRDQAEADEDGRVVVLPCKVGERWTDEEGRAVRITAVIVSIDLFGTSINIYFDYEDATPDDAGSDCVTNWNYFSRHYTCIEAERAMEG